MNSSDTRREVCRGYRTKMGDFSNFPVLFTEEDNNRIMRENVEIEKEMQRWLKENSYQTKGKASQQEKMNRLTKGLSSREQRPAKQLMDYERTKNYSS